LAPKCSNSIGYEQVFAGTAVVFAIIIIIN